MPDKQTLGNERGFTLIEVTATALIMAAAFAAMFIAFVYADKALTRNYHDRVATLYASGEMDWQKYFLRTQKRFDSFRTKTVVLESYESGNQLLGVMSFNKPQVKTESVLGQLIPYQPIIIQVQWVDPKDKRARQIAVREDFYDF